MSISKTQSQGEAKEILAQMDALRKRAARQAKHAAATSSDVPVMDCEILPLGDGLISMGEHFGGIGDAFYEAGETAPLQLPIAVTLFDKGYVNFEGAKQASEEMREKKLQSARARLDAQKRAQEEAEAAELQNYA